MDQKNLADLYGLDPIPWSRALEALSAPSAGPPPWDLYAVAPTTIFGVRSAEPGGATRWRFDV